MNVEQKIYACGIVPVVTLDRAEDAIPVAKALYDGGLACIEVTYRTAAAAESIKQIVQAFPEILVGAGTVLTVSQIEEATAAGATFLVSPGFNPTTAKFCSDRDIPFFPGCNNASTIELALELGYQTLKFFPAEQSGGVSTLKALSAPFPSVRFIPTGGINEKNVKEYLTNTRVLACGGSWMVTKDLILSGNFKEITRRAQAAVALSGQIR